MNKGHKICDFAIRYPGKWQQNNLNNWDKIEKNMEKPS